MKKAEQLESDFHSSNFTKYFTHLTVTRVNQSMNGGFQLLQ